MVSCHICSEAFKLPVCLPCGHVFCSQCILITVQTVKPPTPMHRCPTCRSWYNVGPLDTKSVPSNLRPFVTPSVRPLHMDGMHKMGSTSTPNSSRTSSESSVQNDRSSSLSYPLSDDNVSSEMVRLRAENHALRNHCSMWRKRAEAHGEANLNLLKFARALRDQASQTARDRNELEDRCLMLKRQLDGESSYFDELQKYGQSSRTPAVGPDLGPDRQTGEDRSHKSVPSPALPGSTLHFGNRLARLDPDQSRKRPRILGDANGE